MAEQALDDILMQFIDSTTGEMPTPVELQKWVNKYPKYSRDIIDFALTWVEQEYLRKVVPPHEISEEKNARNG